MLLSVLGLESCLKCIRVTKVRHAHIIIMVCTEFWSRFTEITGEVLEFKLLNFVIVGYFVSFCDRVILFP